MYFGNGNGVLEYDGISWRLISIPHQSVRSLAILSEGENDRIIVGGTNELGYLTPDPNGDLYYESLRKYIPGGNKEFGDVWNILVSNGRVYFQTFTHLFCWTPSVHLKKNEEAFIIWKPVKSFHSAFLVYNKFYIRDEAKGLMTMLNDSLVLIPNGEQFVNDRIYTMLPYSDNEKNKILIGTRNNGLFLYDGFTSIRFKTQADNFLLENKLYLKGSKLADGYFALGTIQGGLVIIDKDGKLRKILNKSSGLRNDNVHFIYQDKQEGLWLALGNGISRVMMPASISVFDESSGLKGAVFSIQMHQGRLYAATSQGLYYLPVSEKTRKQSVFRRVPGIESEVWYLLSIEEELLVAARVGVCRIENNQVSLLNTKWDKPFVLFRSKQNTDRVYVGLLNGLAELHLENGKWVDGGHITGISEEIRSITEDKTGNLWLGTDYQGVMRVELSTYKNSTTVINIDRFGEAQGVPAQRSYVFNVNDRLGITTSKGWRYYNPDKGLIEPDSTFGAFFADTTLWLQNVVEDNKGRIWIAGGWENIDGFGVIITREDGPFHWEQFSYITNLLNLDISYPFYTIYPDETQEDVVWIGNEVGLIRFNYAAIKRANYSADFRTLVRKVIINEDSVIFGGTFQPLLSSSLNKDGIRGVTLTYQNNNLSFEYTATSYDDEKANKYQYYLEGFDKDWSSWKNKSRKEYTNLPAGEYYFRVRSKNIYDHLGKEDKYLFTILPPWYFTWWAYFLYIAVAVLGIIGLIKSRVRYLEKETNKLEAIVAERTAQVVDQKNRLEEQKGKLEVQSEKLLELDHLKSRFFTNVSHEFRTPLTLILGHTDSMLTSITEEKNKNKLSTIFRNARMLLRLINQLLDISKLEAGSMELHAVRSNFIPFLKNLVYSWESFAERKQITLKFQSDQEEIEFYFDTEKLEKVFYNLLSNAFKFTSAGGTVWVRVKIHSPLIPPSKGDFEDSPSESGVLYTGGVVEITVKDTGIGIPADRLPRIFDRFYQVDGSHTREQEGTGIGLSIAKELVELHHGEISVNSEEGVETEFTVRLPLGDAHLKEDQIVKTTIVGAKRQVDDIEINDSDQEPVASTLPASDKDREIILIVEDNPDLRAYIREHLASSYTVLEAANGEEGIAKALEAIPDLVITDVMMPRIDGYQLSRILKNDEKTSHIPIVMLTAKALEESKIEGLKTGVDDYLTKPFNSRELLVRIGNLIKIRRQLRDKFSTASIIDPSDVTSESIDKTFLEKIFTIIDENIGNEEFDVDALSKEAAISVSNLHRKLKALIGQTPGHLIRSKRLQRAANLLKQNAGTVTEIAYIVGFSDQAHFTKSFTKQFNCSPSEYKKRNRTI